MTVVPGLQQSSKLWYSNGTVESDIDDQKKNEEEIEFDDSLGEKPGLAPQGVDPRRGWDFRGVHKVFDAFFFFCFWCDQILIHSGGLVL